jgi:hypothetical protein
MLVSDVSAKHNGHGHDKALADLELHFKTVPIWLSYTYTLLSSFVTLIMIMSCMYHIVSVKTLTNAVFPMTKK